MAPSVDNANATWLVTGNDALQRVGVSGWAPVGATILVSLGGKTVAATSNSDGRWEVGFEGKTLPADGTYRAQVSITERDGTQHHLAGPRAMIDVTGPEVDVTEGSQSAGHVFDAADRADGIELGGTAEAGAKVVITMDGIPGGTATAYAGADGTWEVTFPANLFPRGEYGQPITVTATDAFGNATVTRDAVLIDTSNCSCTRIGIDDVTADNVVNAAEDKGGVTLSGTAIAGSVVKLVLTLEDGETLDAETVADSRGIWAARLDKDLLPEGEYSATLNAIATSPAGVVNRASHEFRVDTLVNQNDIHASTATGDGIVNAAEVAGGFELTGKTEAGAQQVLVHFEGVRRLAAVDADGNWSVTFTPNEFRGGEFTSAVTVSVTDWVGNTRIDTALLNVDTVADAAGINTVLHGAQDVLGIGTEGGDQISLTLIDGQDQVSVGYSSFTTPAGQMSFFDDALPDGSLLVVGSQDLAGNHADTLVLMGDDGNSRLDLSQFNLNGFDVAELDLNFAPEANLVITEAQLRDLSGQTDTLVVHGDAQDSVTAIGANSTGEVVDVDGSNYHVYTLGDSGASLVIHEDITVHTSVV